MSLIIEATYENGILKPDKPLPLQEPARVRLAVTPLAEPTDPLGHVVGVCTEGPATSLAERHDELLHGLQRRSRRQS